MLSTLMMVSLVMTCGCSEVLRSSSEVAHKNRTDTTKANTVKADSGGEVKNRVTRSDVRPALLTETDPPGFWPSRGRRSSPEDMQTPLWQPYWRSGAVGKFIAEGRLNLGQPLYAEEPAFILMDRRHEQGDSPDGSQNEDDPFWVTRGRRHYQVPFNSEFGQSFWASTRRLHDVVSDEKLFGDSGNGRTENGLIGSGGETFGAARRKKSSFKFVEGPQHRYGARKALLGSAPCWPARGRRSPIDDSRHLRGFLKSLPVEEPFWAARGKKSDPYDTEESRDTRGLLKSASAEEPLWAGRRKRSASDSNEESRVRRRPLELTSPFESPWPRHARQPAVLCANNQLDTVSAEDTSWVARGRRNDRELRDRSQRGGSLLDSLSSEEPFWAARGRRRFLDSLSTEEPFWAARGKKESPRMTSTSPEELLSQIRSRGVQSKADPWWPVRGKRGADGEHESFWQDLERRMQNDTVERIPTS